LTESLGGGIIWSIWFSIANDWSAAIIVGILSQCGLESTATSFAIVKTLSSVFLEQMVACPLVYSLWDIPDPLLLRGESVESVAKQVKSKIGGLLLENAKIWSIVNLITYNVPMEFRVLFMSTCDMFWQSVISEVASSTVEDGQADWQQVHARVIQTQSIGDRLLQLRVWLA
jgi:hypothetical protein